MSFWEGLIPETAAVRTSYRPILTGYVDHLCQQGASIGDARRHFGPAKDLVVWLEQTDTDPAAADDEVLRRFLQHDCSCPVRQRAVFRRRFNCSTAFWSRLSDFVR